MVTVQVPDEQVVRRAFVNSTRSRAAAATFPRPWPPARAEDLDFVGWADPKAPQRAYVVLGPEVADEVVALELRLSEAPPRSRATMCDLCRTQDAPDGARLVVAPRAGARGRSGDSVGLYVCSDFACSRRARTPLKAHERPVSGASDERVPELVGRVRELLERVRGG